MTASAAMPRVPIGCTFQAMHTRLRIPELPALGVKERLCKPSHVCGSITQLGQPQRPQLHSLEGAAQAAADARNRVGRSKQPHSIINTQGKAWLPTFSSSTAPLAIFILQPPCHPKVTIGE